MNGTSPEILSQLKDLRIQVRSLTQENDHLFADNQKLQADKRELGLRIKHLEERLLNNAKDYGTQ